MAQAGNDTLKGADGDDWLEGGDGADKLYGDAGADDMIGGLGNDSYYVDNVGDVVTELAAGGTDEVRVTLASYTLGTEVENLTGTATTGQALTGNALNNTIIGDAGADTLSGLDGVDTLKGGAGADRLIGGAGNDTLSGGTEADVFVASVGGGADKVTDFLVGTDKLDVTAFGAYVSIVQSGADTIVTLAGGVTFRLTGVTAGTVTNASFIGLSGPAPALMVDAGSGKSDGQHDLAEQHRQETADHGWFL